MIARTVLLAVAGGLLALLQSTVLDGIAVFGAVPDVALIVLVFFAWRYGCNVGQIAGFLSGLAFDVLSLAPMGYHALLYALVGFGIGNLKGQIAPDRVLLPAAAVFAATLVKRGGGRLLGMAFRALPGEGAFFTAGLGMEFAMNVALAVPVFLLCGLIARLTEGRRGGFQ